MKMSGLNNIFFFVSPCNYTILFRDWRALMMSSRTRLFVTQHQLSFISWTIRIGGWRRIFFLVFLFLILYFFSWSFHFARSIVSIAEAGRQAAEAVALDRLNDNFYVFFFFKMIQALWIRFEMQFIFGNIFTIDLNIKE